MKNIFYLLMVMALLSSCGSSNDDGNSPIETAKEISKIQKDVNANQKAAKERKQKPIKEIAMEYLTAVKDKNLEKVKSYELNAAAIQLDQAKVDEMSDNVKDWDGTIREIRYGYGMTSEIINAYVYYGEFQPDYLDSPLNKVCVFMKVKSTWHSWDFTTMSKEKFEKLSTELPLKK